MVGPILVKMLRSSIDYEMTQAHDTSSVSIKLKHKRRMFLLRQALARVLSQYNL